uniref:Uncharacterized protein n=1 Tax=Anguilla anguilla TaxID=7936 RepID=A0A0E9QDH5_ANGAN
MPILESGSFCSTADCSFTPTILFNQAVF